jgi:hypothetical protein
MLLIPLILSVVLLIIVIIVAVVIYNKEQDYKNNVDQKVSAAVIANTKKVQAADAKQFAEQEKKPLRTYTGPSEYGTIIIQYPKTWSAYVDESGGGNPIEGYFSPGYVPGANNQNSVFALRVELVQQPYDQVLRQFNGLAQQGEVKIKPYHSDNIATNTYGSRIDGEIEQNKKGSMIVLPLRNMTFELYTESTKYIHDFNKIILPNFSFRP